MNVEALKDIATDGVARALHAGADEAEVFVQFDREAGVDLQKDDVHTATTSEETIIGVRVFRGGALGFASVNGTEHLDLACREAVALARVSPVDPANGLGDPRPLPMLAEPVDQRLAEFDVEALVDIASRVLARIAAADPRVRVDSGAVSAGLSGRAVASSRGVLAADLQAAAGLGLFGMAVSGDDVGSFDTEGHRVRGAAELEAEFLAAADRFVIKTLGALDARKGESFRGTVILTPEVVRDFVLGNLLAVLDAKAVRNGKSPYADKIGSAIAASSLTLRDDPHRPRAARTAAFDREGMPTAPLTILDRGVLGGFLADVHEARARGVPPPGHARGGAGTLPSIGPSNLTLAPGEIPFSKLCCDPARAVLVSRFSGACNPVTGEFSGVVKGGFLLRQGERRPLKETLIAGNLHTLLLSVSGLSKEVRNLSGHSLLPALRVEDISVTAG